MARPKPAAESSACGRGPRSSIEDTLFFQLPAALIWTLPTCLCRRKASRVHQTCNLPLNTDRDSLTCLDSIAMSVITVAHAPASVDARLRRSRAATNHSA